LFGTSKGGFTGAKNRPGLFEQANGGTILFDEINSMDPALQAKLLRVLEENKVRRVGGQKEIDIDTRIIATINTHPDRAIEDNQLREDLYYRLSVVYLEIPPLRERRSDIPLLTEHFIQMYNRKFSRSILGVSTDLKKKFLNYRWPGNVRELQHIIESAFNMIQDEEVINFSHLPGYFKVRLRKSDQFQDPGLSNLDLSDNGSLPGLLEKIELKMLKRALTETGWNISAAARKLNISRQSLHYKINKYGIKNA
ncbi:MAG: sigma 54-interacting transcriptional regulator, partial [Halanaerobiales bacterium]